MDWHHDIDCERGCFPGPDTACECEIRALRAENERLREFIERHGPHFCPYRACVTCEILPR